MNTEVADFLSGVEVKYVSAAEWLRATVGLLMDVPHVSGVRKPLVAMPPVEWELV